VIVLDTNVISEPLRMQPDPGLARWLDSQSRESLFLTVTSLTELKVGIATLPVGKRREQLERATEMAVAQYFGQRILTVTKEVAEQHALIVAQARAQGVVIAFADAQIAAIAAVHGFSVATRDVIPFKAAGVEVINPWTA
jgi:predicted nucleic acid-binding protein